MDNNKCSVSNSIHVDSGNNCDVSNQGVLGFGEQQQCKYFEYNYEFYDFNWSYAINCYHCFCYCYCFDDVNKSGFWLT